MDNNLEPLRDCAAAVLEGMQHNLSPANFQTLVLGTALVAAAERGDEEMFARLLGAGARCHEHFRCRNSLRTLIGAAAFGGNAGVVERLLGSAEGTGRRQINVTFGATTTSPLYVAVQQNAAEVATSLLRYGADPNIPDNRGVYPLHLAATLGYRACIAAILQTQTPDDAKKAEVDDCDCEGWTPLLLAVENGHADIVGDLLGMGANPVPQKHSGRLRCVPLNGHVQGADACPKGDVKLMATDSVRSAQQTPDDFSVPPESGGADHGPRCRPAAEGFVVACAGVYKPLELV